MFSNASTSFGARVLLGPRSPVDSEDPGNDNERSGVLAM